MSNQLIYSDLTQDEIDKLARMDIDVKLDRITIVGNFNVKYDALKGVLCEIGWDYDGADDEGYDKFVLLKERPNARPENKAVIMHNKFQSSWRLDTSNHLDKKEKITVIRALLLMKSKHITRIDIAFDFINGPYKGMRHRIFAKNVTQAHLGENLMYGRSKKIETIYVGRRKSLSLYRYYDKLVEQRSQGKKLDPSIESWERLEIQLRGAKTKEWLASAKEMLEGFKLPNIAKAVKVTDTGKVKPLSFQEACAFQVLVEDPSAWSRIGSKSTKAKYQKLIEENDGYGFNTSYAKMAYDELKVKKKALAEEVESFLADLKEREKQVRDGGAM